MKKIVLALCLLASTALAQDRTTITLQPVIYQRTIPNRLYCVPVAWTNFYDVTNTVPVGVTNTVTLTVTNTVTQTVNLTNVVDVVRYVTNAVTVTLTNSITLTNTVIINTTNTPGFFQTTFTVPDGYNVEKTGPNTVTVTKP